MSDLLKIKEEVSSEKAINLSEFINKNTLSPNEIIAQKTQPNFINIKNNNLAIKLEQKTEVKLNLKNDIKILENFPFVPHSDFFNPLIVFDLHPLLPIIAIGSLDKSIRIFNFYSKEFICQKNFENEITAIKFNNDGKLLCIGYLNGDVFILDSHMTDKNYLENKKRLNTSNKSNIKFQNSYNDDDNNAIDEENNITNINFKNIYDRRVLTNENLDFENLNLFHIPNLDVLQIISNLSTSVILINFSKNDDFMAISYNNKINLNLNDINSYSKNLNINNENKNINYNFHGGSIVSLYVFKFSKLNIKHNYERKNYYNNNNYTPNDINAKNNINRGITSNKKNVKSQINPQEEIYFKISDISIPVSQYESTNMNRNECATTAIDFSNDSLFILFENQIYNKNSKVKNEAVYIVWDIENTQLVIDSSILKKLKFSRFSFSNSVESYDFLNFLNIENNKKKEKIQLIYSKDKNFDDFSENANNINNKNDNNKTNNKKIFKQYNFVSNVENFLFKNIDKNYLEYFKNNNYITSMLPLLNFNFDYGIHRNTIKNSDIENNFSNGNNFTNSKANKNYTGIDSKVKTNQSKNSGGLIKNLINQHIACGSNNGNIHLFRYIYLLNEFSSFNSNYNNFREKKTVSEIDSNNSNLIEITNNNRGDDESYNNVNFSNINNKIKFLKNEKIGVSRSFSGHCNKINLIKSTSDESFLFTSDVNDQIIIEWKIKKENINSDLENFPIEIFDDDPFIETIAKDPFFALVEDFWLNRLRLTEYFTRYFENNNFFFNRNRKELDFLKSEEEFNTNNKLKNDIYNSPSITKKSHNNIRENINDANFKSNNNYLISSNINILLTQVIGRRSLDRRNNLFCDSNNRLIYFTSSYIIFTNLNSLIQSSAISNSIIDNIVNNNNNCDLIQNFLIPIENLTKNIQSEISCICLSFDKQEIAVALNGELSLVNIFEINTMENISKIYLENFPIVNNIKFSNCKEKLLGIAINRNYYSVIFIINIKLNKLESTFINSGMIPYKIKDLEFEYNRSDIFISCGIQHLSIWRSQGGYLVNKNIILKLENEKINSNAINNNVNYDKNNFFEKKNKVFSKQKKKINRLLNNDDEIENSDIDEENESDNNNNENKDNLINKESNTLEVISVHQKNKKFGVFLINEKDKIEEFINYNFCSKENYKKYFLNVKEDITEENNQEDSNNNEEENENLNYRTQDYEENSLDNNNYTNDNKTSNNYNIQEIDRQNFTNNFNYNYYFNNFLHVSFLSIKRIKRNYILTADDGNLYLMQDYQLKNSIPAHSGYITAIEINEENKYLITGGLDGKVNLFNISIDSKGIIRNIYKVNTYYTYNNFLKDFSIHEILLETNFNVQSICVFNNKILVGTRNGNIMDFDINYLSDDNKNDSSKKNQIKEDNSHNISNIDISKSQNDIKNKNLFNFYVNKNILFNFFDDQPPIDIAIDTFSKRIFCISHKGFFYVYMKKNMKLIYTYDFKIKTKKIYHFKYQNRLLIVFENSLCVLDTITNKGDKNNFCEEFNRLPLFDLNAGFISDLQISSNEKLMAIASVNNSNPQLYM